MTTYVGGLRNRLIRDSIYWTLYNSLESLNWFATNTSVDPSIQIVLEDEFDEHQEIPLNTIAISAEGQVDEDAEIGSTLGLITTTYYVDFYAQDDTVGRHLIHDVKDILLGRFSSIDRTAPVIEVYDYTMATPPLLFVCDVLDVRTDKARNFPKPWQQHWHVCRFDIEDSYASDAD